MGRIWTFGKKILKNIFGSVLEVLDPGTPDGLPPGMLTEKEEMAAGMRKLYRENGSEAYRAALKRAKADWAAEEHLRLNELAGPAIFSTQEDLNARRQKLAVYRNPRTPLEESVYLLYATWQILRRSPFLEDYEVAKRRGTSRVVVRILAQQGEPL